MIGFLEMMTAPVAIALILVAMHGYLGTHVVRRGVIFVDIALAQIAAFGVAAAMFFGAEVGTLQAFLAGIGSTLIGAFLLSFTRSRNKMVPQEAYIGIVYVVSSAAMILVLSQVAHGGEEISNLLVGSILWVTWTDVLKALIFYSVLALILKLAHRPLMEISIDPGAAKLKGMNLLRWDFLFYMILGAVVTLSVQVAGVLMVFTLLVVPTVMALRLVQNTGAQFLFIMIVGTIAVILGSGVSYLLDLPTGAAIVCSFGLLLTLQILWEGIRRR